MKSELHKIVSVTKHLGFIFKIIFEIIFKLTVVVCKALFFTVIIYLYKYSNHI